MLRLIIADDERIIRETISKIIDWEKLNITVVGLCENGIEAMDMILDCYPDIVLTDIKMPGLSGLDLIRQISNINPKIQFVILSGYGEFEFAKEAMHYGVQHYLLKPCNEAQIMEVMKEVASNCMKLHSLEEAQEVQQTLSRDVYENTIRNILMEGISGDSELDFSNYYECFVDFEHTPYKLYYLYYLEESSLQSALIRLDDYAQTYLPNESVFITYVKNTLVLFFIDDLSENKDFENFLHQLTFIDQEVSIEIRKQNFNCLTNLLSSLISRLKRYERVYIMNGTHMISTTNYNVIEKSCNTLFQKMLLSEGKEKEQTVDNLLSSLRIITDVEYLKALISGILLKNSISPTSPFSTQNITELTAKLVPVKSVNDCLEHFSNFIFGAKHSHTQAEAGDFIAQTIRYVEEHYSDSDLTLKWIADNILFMNVDYISKQFLKRTGVKFSSYITNIRIERAKELLLSRGSDKIYSIAEEVGFGNNPQYFWQLFKKQTTYTPSAFIKQHSTSLHTSSNMN